MSNLVNLHAETNANLIGDDSSPTLTLKNSSSGTALKLDNTGGTGTALDVTTSGGAGIGAEVLSDNTSYAARIRNAAATAPALKVGHSVAASATVAPIKIAASTASQAVIGIEGVFMSTASISIIADATAFIIPVYHETENVWGYISASKGVV